MVGGGGRLLAGGAAVLDRVEADPAAAHVTDWTALTARAPVPFTAGLAPGLGQAGGVRPAATLGVRPAPGQGVPLLHHYRPPAPHTHHRQVRVHLDTRKSVSITITELSPPVPVLQPVLPLDGVLVVVRVVAGPHLAVDGPALGLDVGPVCGVVPGGQAGGRGEGPRPAGPGRQGVGGPVAPGHETRARSVTVETELLVTLTQSIV